MHEQTGGSLPLWKPTKRFLDKIDTFDLRKKYKVIRSNSSGYANKPQIREYILHKFKHTCTCCGSKENLTIEHVIPVRDAIYSNIPLSEINNVNNLSVLCRMCNSKEVKNAR